MFENILRKRIYLLLLIVCTCIYALAIGGWMLHVLWQEQHYGGGNHWIYFATPLDGFIQRTGYWGLFPLCVPPFVVAWMALKNAQIFWSALLTVAGGGLAVIIHLFVLMALD